MNRDAVVDVEGAILAYLDAHPDAADSAAGIQRWWLPRALENVTLFDVERALLHLVASQVVGEFRLPDGGVIFGAGAATGRIKT